MAMPLGFGWELRRLRGEAGFTLGDLAQEVNYSRSHLSRIERGEKRPSMDLARRCDTLFGAGGRLQRLVGRYPSKRVERMRRAGKSMARRSPLTVGAASLIGFGSVDGERVDRPEGVSLTGPFLAQLDQMRQLGQVTEPTALLDLLEAQTRTVTKLAVTSGSRDGARLFVLAAHFADFTGWMAQEAGDNESALGWTASAVELAQAGGDRDLAFYALVRRALVTFYDADAEQTIALASRAQESRLPFRIRGLAAQREAQGHALIGDEHSCMRSLDRARHLLDSASGRTGTGPVIGTSHLTDPAAMVTGWCLFDLGRPREAAEVFDRECLGIAPQALRTRARYGLRRALAHAAAGEIEHSCEIAGELLDMVIAVRSATVTADLRRLARELARFRTNRSVRDLQPALARALHTIQA
ncbi:MULTISPECIES: helix-turn-helix transcriptional regulator [unclassified Kitasatospora]